MRTVSISVTEASRNFADCVNRARYQGTTFILEKNGVPVARLVPEPKPKEAAKIDADSSETEPAAKNLKRPRDRAGILPEIW
ncbi:MAG TPA: type II toxin-antitoxin system prevent-host-death family antitoxin [Terracidiphilus sp.]|jgi:prevent-host-death family protein|nr:type II toxin-antitoxin system prevent-host-death family antitoxin [Terracidiphilus sp.]